MNLKEMHETQKQNGEEKKSLTEYIEALEREQSRAAQLEQELTKAQAEKKSAVQSNSSLIEQLENLKKSLTAIDNAPKILSELNRQKKQNEETAAELEQRKSQLTKKENLLSMTDKELSERERAVSDTEQAVKRKAAADRSAEIAEHEKVMQEAEKYRSEQEALLKAQGADLSKVEQEHRERVEKSLKKQYTAFKTALQGYVAIITIALFGVSVFSIISQKTFCIDFLNFFKGVPGAIMAGVTKIADLIPIESGIVAGVVLVALVALALTLAYLLYAGASEVVGVWYFSIMGVLLAGVVFFSAEIKPLIKGFNLFGAWLIAFVGSLTAIEVFYRIRDMRRGVIQDRTKNISMFVGLAAFGILLFVMVW